MRISHHFAHLATPPEVLPSSPSSPPGRKDRHGIITGKNRHTSQNTHQRLEDALKVLDALALGCDKVLDLVQAGFNVSPGKVEREAYRIRRCARRAAARQTEGSLPQGTVKERRGESLIRRAEALLRIEQSLDSSDRELAGVGS